MTPYSVVEEFEKAVAEYAGAKYGVAVNSCSNALMLSAIYRRITDYTGNERNNRGYVTVYLPKYTYVGVPYAMLNAGYKIKFIDKQWRGSYYIEPIDIVDSARRFYEGMYEPDTLYCVSFHERKSLPIGDGGMILTDDEHAYDALRQMRFDGRTPGKSVHEDTFTLPAYHANMKPDVAMRGLMLMSGVKPYYQDLPEVYPDLSKFSIFTGGYNGL